MDDLVLGALKPVTADLAILKPHRNEHSIWEIVAHLTAELNYARAVVEGTAGPWIEGQMTWPTITDTSEVAWREALVDLRQANRGLVSVVKQLQEVQREVLAKFPPPQSPHSRALLGLLIKDELPTGLPEGDSFTLRFADALDDAMLSAYTDRLEQAGLKDAAEHVRSVIAAELD